MEVRYSRQHVRESVALAMVVGVAWGLWLGARMEHAGVLEAGAAFVAMVVTYSVGFSRIDKRHSVPSG